jgi:hypothetical protein
MYLPKSLGLWPVVQLLELYPVPASISTQTSQLNRTYHLAGPNDSKFLHLKRLHDSGRKASSVLGPGQQTATTTQQRHWWEL